MKKLTGIDWKKCGTSAIASMNLEHNVSGLADLQIMFRSAAEVLGVILSIKNWDVSFCIDVPSQEEGKGLALTVLTYASKIINAANTKQLTHYTEWNGEEYKYPAEGILHSIGEALAGKFSGNRLELDSPYFDDERLLGVYMN